MGDSFLSVLLTKMISVLLYIIFIIFSFSIILTLSTNSSFSNNSAFEKQGFVVKLIHRDLIYPSKYPPISTHLDQTDLALNRVPRRSIPPNNVSVMSHSPEAMGKIGSREHLAFYAEIYMGTQNIRQYVVLDTGSLTLWVQCKGSVGHETNNPKYDPYLSKSYVPLRCRAPGDHKSCKRVVDGECDYRYDRCRYSVKYGDKKSRSKGFLGFETIKFNKEDDHSRHAAASQAQVSNVLFGCGTYNILSGGFFDGILGIGPVMEGSILDKTKRKFSFCFGSVNDPNYQYNHLALGDDAKLISDQPVTMNYKRRKYYYDVKLIGIRVGEHRIKMKSLTVLIDSGANFSYLKKSIYLQMSRLVEQEMQERWKRRKKVQVPGLPKEALCYEGPSLANSFPQISLDLDPHYTLQLDKKAMFLEYPKLNAFCLAFLPSTNSLDMIGLTALQYHNVGFDLNTNLVYFKKMDCKSLMIT